MKIKVPMLIAREGAALAAEEARAAVPGRSSIVMAVSVGPHLLA